VSDGQQKLRNMSLGTYGAAGALTDLYYFLESVSACFPVDWGGFQRRRDACLAFLYAET
jgi:hypothetical protein